MYLWYSEQLQVMEDIRNYSCELLSKTCIFDILNNRGDEQIGLYELWIAFKNLYLWYSEQRIALPVSGWESCELLSKTCIFDILNNARGNELRKPYVVNCFQKLVSLIFWTTTGKIYIAQDRLWIAFKNLYLWYSEQHE